MPKNNPSRWPTPKPPRPPSKIYHACTFYNEVELLRLQLHELCDVVDVFVVGEGNFDFAGNPKTPLIPAILDELNVIAKGKLQYLPIDLSHLQGVKGTRQSVRQAEIDSRNAIYHWLAPRIGLYDTIWCADIDNIPKPMTLVTFSASDFDIAVVTCERVCAFALNLTEKKPGSLRDSIVKGSFLLKHGRLHDIRFIGSNNQYKDGQWAFSYIAPPKEMEAKLAIWGLYEEGSKGFSVDIWKKVVRNSIDRNPAMLEFRNVLTLDESFPKHVQKNIDYYKKIGWWYDPDESGVTPSKV